MDNTHTPRTVSEVLRAMQSPLCVHWSWHRREGKHGAALRVTLDDMDNDRRTVIDMRERNGAPPMIYRSTLHKFDAARNMWGEYLEERVATQAPDRRGWGALVQYVQRQAIATKYVPNPEHVHYFKAAGEQ